MENKKIIITGVIVIAALMAGFFGGTKYASAKAKTAAQTRGAQFAGFNDGQGRTGGMRNMGGMTAGEILSMDGKSITIKSPAGGSKIIFLSDSMTVSKTIPGTRADLATGKFISISGTINADGSITAKTIDLRTAPAQMTQPTAPTPAQ